MIDDWQMKQNSSKKLFSDQIILWDPIYIYIKTSYFKLGETAQK